MYQQITLVGRLGGDMAMRYTPTGVAVTNGSLAVSKSRQDKNGQWQETTAWFRLNLWREQAERAAEQFQKGDKILVTGELEEPKIWTDRSGTARVTLEIKVHTIRRIHRNISNPVADSDEQYHGSVEVEADGEETGEQELMAIPF